MPDWYVRLADADRLLALIALSTAILLLIAVAFALLTVALRLRSMRRSRVRSQLEQRWEPLVLATLSGDMSTAEMLRHVPERHALFFVTYLLRFVSRFAGDERRTLSELARTYLPAVAAQLRSRRPEARARAVQTLVLLGLDEYDREVVSALDDPSLTVAMVAARALASKEHTRFAPEILRRMQRFHSWTPAYLSSLFSGMGSEVVPALRAIYRDEDAPPVARRVAADALHDLDDIGSVETAALVARTSTDMELVGASLRLLGRVGGPEYAVIPRDALARTHPWIRMRAAEALGEIGGAQDLLRLQAALDDPSPWVALAAARSIHRTGGRDLLVSLAGEETHRGELAREVLAAGGRA